MWGVEITQTAQSVAAALPLYRMLFGHRPAACGWVSGAAQECHGSPVGFWGAAGQLSRLRWEERRDGRDAVKEQAEEQSPVL